MGFALSWLAIRGKSAEDVYARLGLCPTGMRSCEFSRKSPRVGCTLPSGWILVIEDHGGLASDDVLAALSCDCEVVACEIEEHVMVSHCVGWRNGRRTWSVLHDAQAGSRHLEVQGELPPIFPAIRDRLFTEQKAAGDDEVDYIFDIPVELASTLVGYRHDMTELEGDEPFEVLGKSGPSNKSGSSKKSWLARIFGV